MTTKTLAPIAQKIENIENILLKFMKPREVLGKIYVDKKTLKQAKNAIFDFDIEDFVTKNDLKMCK